MLNSLNVIMWISFIVVVFCVFLIFQKFIRYFANQKRALVDQKKNIRDIRILEVKLPEIKLKNKGESLDENIDLIYDDVSIGFAMNWGDIFE